MKYLAPLWILLLLGSAAYGLPSDISTGLHWRFVGPYRGGRTVAATGVEGHPGIWYFGSADGGVFRTTNAGTNWTPLFQHKPVASIGAIADAPSAPETLYLGTGECDIRSGVSYGDGVWKSTDAGTHWSHDGLDRVRHVCSLSIDPNNPNVVLAAALGDAWRPNRQRGVYLTTDGGQRWKKVLYVNSQTGAIDLARAPGNASIVYATTWDARRMPWFQYAPVQGKGSAIWRSDDGGRHWVKLPMRGLPKTPWRIGVAVAPKSRGRTVYAIVSAKVHGGLYRSVDGGRNWTLINGSHRLWGRGWYFGHVTISPSDPQIIYIPNTALYRSVDGGRHFTAIKGSPDGDDFHLLWINPKESSQMIVAADQGASISLDAGRHWSSWYDEPTAQIYRVATSSGPFFKIYATQQDSGSLAIPYRSYEGVITNRSWKTSGGGEAGYVIPQPHHPGIVFGSDYLGHVSRLNTKTHQITNISPVPIVPFAEPIGKREYRFNWVTPIALSPFNPDTVYSGAQMVFKSSDRGEKWSTISPVLTRTPEQHSDCADARTPAQGNACGYGSIFTIALSPIKRGIIWAGTTDSKIWISRDNGRKWENVTPRGLPAWSRIDRIEPSPFSPGIAWAAVDRHRVGDLHPYIYKTDDYGHHWIQLEKGIAARSYVHVVRADPDRPGLLFAGTETGVYVSFNGGHIWKPFNINLPTVSIRDIDIHHNDVILGTHGRGIWAMDDINPLLQATNTTANQEVHLYKPQPTMRIRPSHYHGEAMPPSVPQAENPPSGAVIDFYLKHKASSKVTLSIYSLRGQLIRRYSSDEGSEPMPKPNFAPWWKAPRAVLTANQGNNRFVWNLRYAPPTVIDPAWGGPGLMHGTPRGVLGPLVAPGKYRIVLTVDGVKRSAQLQVLPNPRVDAAPTVIHKRIQMGLSIALAIENSTRLHRQLVKALSTAQQSGDYSTARRLTTLRRAFNITAIQGRLITLMSTINSADTQIPTQFAKTVKTTIFQVNRDSATLKNYINHH